MEPARALDFPATSRNREPIAEVLARFWPPERPLKVLEVASGSGQHAAFLAERFPLWTLQPTDVEPEHLESIAAYRQACGAENLLEPLRLDVSDRPWPLSGAWDAIFAINLIHISPWSCTQALFREGRSWLVPGGGLYLYGAFRREGRHTAPSNEAFDQGLRERNPEWGVRCLDQVTATAAELGFRRERVEAMPANNLSVLFRLEPPSPGFSQAGG